MTTPTQWSLRTTNGLEFYNRTYLDQARPSQGQPAPSDSISSAEDASRRSDPLTAPDAMTATDICWMITSLLFTFVIPVWPIVAFFMWMTKSAGESGSNVPQEMKEALQLIKSNKTPAENSVEAENMQHRKHLFAVLESFHLATNPLPREEAPSYGYILWSWMKSWAPTTTIPAYKPEDLQSAFLEIVQALPDSTLALIYSKDTADKTFKDWITNLRSDVLPKMFKEKVSADAFINNCKRAFRFETAVHDAPNMKALLQFYDERADLLNDPPHDLELQLAKAFHNLFYTAAVKGKEVRDLSEGEFIKSIQRIWSSFSEETKIFFQCNLDALSKHRAMQLANGSNEQAAVDKAFALEKERDSELSCFLKRLESIGLSLVPRLPTDT